MTTLVSEPQPSERLETLPAQSRSGLHATLWRLSWFVGIPILLTLLTIRYLLPPSVPSKGNPISWIAQTQLANPVIFAVGLFVILSLLFRYWRHFLPGFRTTLPIRRWAARALNVAELHRLEIAAAQLGKLSRPRVTLQRQKALSATQNTNVDRNIGELSNAIAQGLVERAEMLVGNLQSLVGRNGGLKRPEDWLLVAIVIVAPVMLALGLRARVFQSYKISGNSMLPTLEAGDTVGAKPSAYRPLFRTKSGQSSSMIPRRGDIVTFDNPTQEGEEHLVKRVIGLPGDQISMKGGLPVINGWTVPYCDAGVYANVTGDFEPIQGHLIVEFLDDHAYLTLYKSGATAIPFESVYQVKEHEIFVLGDNRNGSSDSRTWDGGRGAGVPISNISGRADRFLIGTTRNGTSDFARLFKHLDGQPHLEGLDTEGLSRRIEKCLRNKPAQSAPPPQETKPMIAQIATQ